MDVVRTRQLYHIRTHFGLQIAAFYLTTVYTIEDVKVQQFLFQQCNIGIGF